MAVSVVHAHRDQPDPCLQNLVEPFALIGGAVVSDLDDVDRADGARGEQRVLCLLAQVAEEDRTHAVALDRESDTATVAAERLLPR